MSQLWSPTSYLGQKMLTMWMNCRLHKTDTQKLSWNLDFTSQKTKIKCSSRSIEATTNPKIKKPTTDGVDVFLYHSMQNIQVIYQCWKCSAVDRPKWFLLLEFLKETETERDGKILKIVFKAKLLNYIQSTSMLCDIKDSLFKSMVHICIYDFESKSKNSW